MSRKDILKPKKSEMTANIQNFMLKIQKNHILKIII